MDSVAVSEGYLGKRAIKRDVRTETDNWSIVEQVVDEVSRIEGVDQTDLPPLYDVVNPDALDSLLGDADRESEGDVRISFSYSGYVVTARDDGIVEIEDRSGHPDSEADFGDADAIEASAVSTDDACGPE